MQKIYEHYNKLKYVQSFFNVYHFTSKKFLSRALTMKQKRFIAVNYRLCNHLYPRKREAEKIWKRSIRKLHKSAENRGNCCNCNRVAKNPAPRNFIHNYSDSL